MGKHEVEDNSFQSTEDDSRTGIQGIARSHQEGEDQSGTYLSFT